MDPIESYSFKEKYKSKLLETFRFAIDFLSIHNLNWFVASGTCLGAVRHHGMIPWDDDIDIFMPRDDYEKLLDLRYEMCGSGFDVVSMRDDGYYTNFGKFINKSTTIWEREEWPFIIGVYIDIFPLDRTELTESSFHKKYERYYHSLQCYRRSISSIPLKSLVSLIRHKHFRAVLHHAVNPLFHLFREDLHNNLLRKEHIFDDPKGTQFITPFWMYGMRELYKANWFEGYCLMPFEDLVVRVPIGYDEYLRYVYGDYMTPPPPEKRVAHHQEYIYYMNLLQSLDVDEIKRRVKDGERIVV